MDAPPPASTLDFAMIERAAQRLEHHVRQTPCVPSAPLSADGAVEEVFLKLENRQRTGSFKERGALNRLLDLDDAARARGVVAASAGNHALGVAYHARRLEIPATICMPSTTPLIKVKRTRALGAEVILHGDGYDEAYARALDVAEDQGRVLIHAFNDPVVMAGQGTIALEVLKDNPWIDVYVIPVGGGGLIAGMALALKETNPKIKVIGVESAAMPGMKRSLEAGRVVAVPPARTLADGIAVSRVGALTFEIIQRYVDEVVTVDDEEIASAILRLLEEEKTVVEAAAAVTVAALVHDRVPQARGKRACAVLSGGNIDVTLLSRIIERGLAKDGRMMQLRINVVDAPGALARLSALLGSLRANILQSQHNRAFTDAPFGEATVELTLETRGPEHIEEIRLRLSEAGYQAVSIIP